MFGGEGRMGAQERRWQAFSMLADPTPTIRQSPSQSLPYLRGAHEEALPRDDNLRLPCYQPMKGILAEAFGQDIFPLVAILSSERTWAFWFRRLHEKCIVQAEVVQ